MTHTKFNFNQLILTLIFGIRASEPPGPGERLERLGLIGLKEDLVNNGYSLFVEEVISKPQYAEELIKSFQFSQVTILSRF